VFVNPSETETKTLDSEAEAETSIGLDTELKALGDIWVNFH